MGLDIVELVMTVEDEFGVHLPDDRLSEAATVGQLRDLVVEFLGDVRGQVCLSSAAFFRVRRCLIANFGAQRSEVRPRTLIGSVLDSTRPKRTWKRLEESLGLRLPRLKLPEAALLILASLFAISLGLFLYGAVGALEWSARFPLFLSPFVAHGLLKSAQRLGTRFPADSVGELAEKVLSCNYSTFVRMFGGVNEAEVWQRLVKLLEEMEGIDPSLVTPRSEFVRDLGLD